MMIAGGTTVTEQNSHQPNATSRDRGDTVDDSLNQIRDSLRGLRFGSVSIIVQDGVVIQIDRTEKRRLRTNNRTSAK
jgi:hypothetical protein